MDFVNLLQVFRDRNPVCPHCQYEFDDDETWYGSVETGDGGESTVECPTCDKQFVVRTHVIHRFDCRTVEDAEAE